MAGVHPFMTLLRPGRRCDHRRAQQRCAIFAAAGDASGLSRGAAYYLGKVLECASFCAEPYGGKETVLGEIIDGGVHVTAMHPGQRCTVASVAGHAMYERSNPYYEYVAGGHARHEPSAVTSSSTSRPRASPARASFRRRALRVKLEGSGKVGERYVGIAAIRDPYSVANVDP